MRVRLVNEAKWLRAYAVECLCKCVLIVATIAKRISNIFY